VAGAFGMKRVGRKPRVWTLGAAFVLLFLCAVDAGPAAAQAAAQQGDGWKFSGAVYGWLPVIENELPTGQKVKITRSDILDNLDMTFMGRGRAAQGRWSLTTDLVYFKLSTNNEEQLLPLLALRKLQLEASLVKPSVGYRFYESGGSSAEVYVGGRYFWLKTTLGLKTLPPAPSNQYQDSDSDSRWDAMVGIRGRYALTDRWYAYYGGDVGGGDSDSVVDLAAGAGYQFGRLAVVAAWRYLDYDFGDDFVLKTMTVNGPLVGVEFAF